MGLSSFNKKMNEKLIIGKGREANENVLRQYAY